MDIDIDIDASLLISVIKCETLSRVTLALLVRSKLRDNSTGRPDESINETRECGSSEEKAMGSR